MDKFLHAGTPTRYRGARTYRQLGCQIGRQSFHASTAAAAAAGAGTETREEAAILAAFANSKIIGATLASSLSTCLGVAVSH